MGPIKSVILSVLKGLIRGYQVLLSPMLGSHCRFYPSCSHYALQALELHGPGRGSVLTICRICRCHPGSDGGLDPVPYPTTQPKK